MCTKLIILLILTMISLGSVGSYHKGEGGMSSSPDNYLQENNLFLSEDEEDQLFFNINQLKNKKEDEEEEDSSGVPVVPIQLPPPNRTLKYHYTDEYLFKTDFSRIMLPFKTRLEDIKNPGVYRDLFTDLDESSSELKFVNGSHHVSQRKKEIKPQLTHHDHHKKNSHDQEDSDNFIKGKNKNSLELKEESEQEIEEWEGFEPKKIFNKNKNSKWAGFEPKKINSSGESSSLEDISLSLNYDNGRTQGEEEEEGKKRRPRRSVVHLYDMVVCATGCNPLAYKGYGCYCGFLGSGITVDGIDRCCAKHDWCYHHAKCPPFLTYFVPYYWTCNDGRPRCVTEYRGWKGVCGANLCECDRQFAECLRKFPCPRSRAMCMTSPWRFWQNFLMFPSTTSRRHRF